MGPAWLAPQVWDVVVPGCLNRTPVQPRPLSYVDGSTVISIVRESPGLGQAGVESGPDLLRGVCAPAALGSGDHHAGGRDPDEGRHAQYLVPTHVA
jgi:hypothetical protein